MVTTLPAARNASTCDSASGVCLHLAPSRSLWSPCSARQPGRRIARPLYPLASIHETPRGYVMHRGDYRELTVTDRMCKDSLRTPVRRGILGVALAHSVSTKFPRSERENIADALIEHELRRNAAVHASENGCERSLSVSREPTCG